MNSWQIQQHHLHLRGKSAYDAFKKSTHRNGIGMTEYKYLFGKNLETQLMVMKMIGSARKRS
eukprot:7081172-Ditylum_brightwellii.AAC.1